MAAITLVIAVFVIVPVSDASTCAPEVASASHMFDHASGDSSHSTPGVDHGICSHGHCHHSASERNAARDLVLVAPHVDLLHARPLDDTVASFIADGLKRPPRS